MLQMEMRQGVSGMFGKLQSALNDQYWSGIASVVV
jgi:hypothetical protein